MHDSVQNARKSPGTGQRLRLWATRLAIFVAAGVLTVALGVTAVLLYFDRQLPSVDALRTYRPPQVTKVTCADGTVCAEFYQQRRTLVAVEALPKHVKDAFLAAEDAEFYNHEGLDYSSMARALVKSAMPGNRVTGASTITQQACRNLLLSQERTFTRKVKEWILTPRMEKALTKEQILGLYLNQIYFGHLRYGIEEAALFYFGKSATALDLGEAATLAGILPLPERINPVTNIVKATRRREYVLSQMARHKFAPEVEVKAAMAKPIVLAPRVAEAIGPYYSEEVRRTLVQRYGEKAVLSDGLRVEIAMDPKLQRALDASVQSGLEAIDRRMGYQGPLGRIEASRFAALRPHLEKRIRETGKRREDDLLVVDLNRLAKAGALTSGKPAEPPVDLPADLLEEKPDAAAEGEGPPTTDEVLARSVTVRPLTQGLRLVGYVSRVDDKTKRAEVDLVGQKAEIAFSQVAWARPRAVGRPSPTPTKISDVMKPGDLVRVRILSAPKGPSPNRWEASLDQIPQVQGAGLIIDPVDRRVVAMTGGYDFNLSAFNRATQAKRQPGSAFKPFVYGAALASQRYSTVSLVNDAPESIRDPYTGRSWKPQNYERSGFEGPMTLRQALTKSKNSVSVRLIEAITPDIAIEFARRAGIQSPMPNNLTLALGTGEVTMLELTNAYATLQSLGRYAEPVTLVKVSDAEGKVLEEHRAAFEETLPAPVAFLTTSLMTSVVEEGTAMAVRELGRPAAGKTGTASEYRDAWFAGYTTDYVAAAWVGFDNHESMGSGETGARAALPLWLSAMRAAEQEMPVRDFEVPPGVVIARIDPTSGLLAGDAIPGRMEPFLEGTEPTAQAPSPDQVDPDKFFMQDQRTH